MNNVLIYGIIIVIIISLSKLIVKMFGSFVRYGYLLLGVFLPIQGGVANWIMWSSLVGTYLLSFIIFNKTDKLINTAVNESSVYDAMNMSMSAYGIGLVIGLVIAIIKYVVI